jgi:protease I
MGIELTNQRIAILATDGFEQVELEKPRQALKEAGAEVTIISLNPGEIQGVNHLDKGDSIPVDLTLDDAEAGDFDALLLPGGLANPDTLRANAAAIRFVRAFARAGKPIAAICHAPWLLIEADLVRGRQLTSWPNIESDVRNAGGEWLNQKVVVDNGIITSRSPEDIPAFNATMIEEFASGPLGGTKRRTKELNPPA